MFSKLLALAANALRKMVQELQIAHATVSARVTALTNLEQQIIWCVQSHVGNEV